MAHQHICNFKEDSADGETLIRCERKAEKQIEDWGWVCGYHAEVDEAQDDERVFNAIARYSEEAQRSDEARFFPTQETYSDVWTSALAAPRYVRWDNVLSKC